VKLTMLGGGGFRTPLVYRALLDDVADRRIDRVTLYDIDAGRLAAIGHVLDQLAAGSPTAPAVETTTDLDAALEGADFVFSAVRVGGLDGRVADERVALDLGVLGQETTGPGGVAFGLRTIPVAVDIARRVTRLAPDAWVINFTNPAGMITEAMRAVLGDRVIGICDSPMGLAQRAQRALHLDGVDAGIDYAGLNHLGWLQGLTVNGADRLPDLVADADALAGTEEGQLFGADWIASLGAVPNEYLYYYYFTRDALAAIVGTAETRGEFLLRQQADFYRAVAELPGSALATWNRVRVERNATYMQETRGAEHARDDADIEDGGYERVAVALMAAIARDEPAELILNVPNGETLPGLPADAVIEVPCAVDSHGPRPRSVSPLPMHGLGLVQQVKAVERLTIAAALEGSERMAVEALALHPLVDSVTVARQLLAGYRQRIPSLTTLFSASPKT
jgi:6-phospho-beta-glucosidase